MKIFGLLCTGLVASLSIGIASADTFSGALCNVNGSNPNAGYNQWGIHNLSSSPLAAVCGAATTTIHSVSVTAYDRSPTDDVRCQVELINSAGNVLFTVGLATSGFATGPLTVSTSTPAITAGLVLECSVPAYNAQNGASHVTTYSAQ